MSNLKTNWENVISNELSEEEIRKLPQEEVIELYDCFMMYFAQIENPKLDPPLASNYLRIKKISQELR